MRHLTTWRRALLACFAVASLAACGVLRDDADPRASSDPGTSCAEAGESVAGCDVPAYPDRPFDVFVPSGYDADHPVPLVVFLHGGGGNSVGAHGTTCVTGDPADPDCLQALGEAEGFLTVYANGTGATLAPELRTWNAGGGNGFACASGQACVKGNDDIAYLEALLDEVEGQYAIDPERVYLIGFSNGAAMAHRAACEMADRVVAVAAVSGANEFATGEPCLPSLPVSVLQVHGTADQCWTYESSTQVCADPDPLPKVGVEYSTAGWVDVLGCAAEPVRTLMPDDMLDGTATSVRTWGNCEGASEVRLMTIEGGGHVFPGGSKQRDSLIREDVVTLDWGVSEIWAFLEEHPRVH